MSETGTIIKNGIWDNNVIFVQLLGMCPLLGVSTNAINGIGMGLATTFVLVGSNIVVSWIRNFIPNDIRIPAYVIVIASFVTMIDLLMNAFFIDLHHVLGIFIPLIVVNCAILGRAEAFACKNNALASAFDGLATGLGFTLALVILGSVRELLGSGKWFDMDVMGTSYHPAIGFILPPGAFIVLGFILMTVRWFNLKRAKQQVSA
ncbi:MAG: electron transport complex subunit E [Magnetococcales bacterium]|nr:electron transport complex subunit E [Magnetococcales bacterium]